MRSGGRGSEAGGKDIPMAAQSRLQKFEFFLKSLFVVAATTTNIFWPRLRMSAFDLFLAMPDWSRRVATSQSLLSYPSSANPLAHTAQHPSIHPCTSIHLQMQHFQLSRLSVFLPPFFFSFLLSVQRLSIIYGGIVRSSVIRVSLASAPVV